MIHKKSSKCGKHIRDEVQKWVLNPVRQIVHGYRASSVLMVPYQNTGCSAAQSNEVLITDGNSQGSVKDRWPYGHLNFFCTLINGKPEFPEAITLSDCIIVFVP